MADADTIVRWLDLLIRQTELGNVVWTQAANGDDTYRYVLGGSRVYIRSRDNDGLLPYVLSVANEAGETTDEWQIYGLDANSALAAPEWLAMRARRLYEVVKGQLGLDPVQSMLQELEQMPPF